MTNMYAHLFPVPLKIWHGGHIRVLPPIITLSAYISKIVQGRGLVTIIDI